jgi:hypothetical protein
VTTHEHNIDWLGSHCGGDNDDVVLLHAPNAQERRHHWHWLLLSATVEY